MRSFPLSLVLLLTTYGLAEAQVPDASIIETAMNAGFEIEFPYFQQVGNVQIVRGGITKEGNYLFLCTSRLIWKLGSVEFGELMQQEIEEEVSQRGGDEQLMLAMYMVLEEKLARIGDFQLGDTVADLKFRVRLEQAGSDWIVTSSKIKESDRNPLYIIDKGDP
jgi:hypothetical protein